MFSLDEINIPSYKVTFTRWRKGSPEELSEDEVDQTTEPPVGEILESNFNIPCCSSLDTTIYELLDDEVVTTTSIPFEVTEDTTDENPVVTEALGEDTNCIMRENINSCNIYLCRWLKNMLSLGFPCYRQ